MGLVTITLVTVEKTPI
ncbi:unnamed protein product [Victoria cruziana]